MRAVGRETKGTRPLLTSLVILNSCCFGRLWQRRDGPAANGRLPHDTGMPDNLEKLTIDVFASRIGEQFRIRAQSGGDLGAELIDAWPLGRRPPAGARGTIRP